MKQETINFLYLISIRADSAEEKIKENITTFHHVFLNLCVPSGVLIAPRIYFNASSLLSL
jgi:hypothetical protein